MADMTRETRDELLLAVAEWISAQSRDERKRSVELRRATVQKYLAKANRERNAEAG